MKYRYAKEPSGQYIDGHNRKDVVKYRQDVFVPFWNSVEPQMKKWDNDGVVTNTVLTNFPWEKCIVLVSHDESTFYAHDCRKTRWVHKDETAKPRTKGEGVSLMVSDFCTPEFCWLRSKDG